MKKPRSHREAGLFCGHRLRCNGVDARSDRICRVGYSALCRVSRTSSVEISAIAASTRK